MSKRVALIAGVTGQDSAYLARLMELAPRIPLEAGVAETYRWFLEQNGG